MASAGTKPRIKERRKHQRLPLSIPVFVRGADEDGREFLEFATALNISAGGMLLAVRRSLPKSAVVMLEIPVAPLPPALVTRTSVRQVKARLVRVIHADDRHLVGLRFQRALKS